MGGLSVYCITLWSAIPPSSYITCNCVQSVPSFPPQLGGKRGSIAPSNSWFSDDTIPPATVAQTCRRQNRRVGKRCSPGVALAISSLSESLLAHAVVDRGPTTNKTTYSVATCMQWGFLTEFQRKTRGFPLVSFDQIEMPITRIKLLKRLNNCLT